MRDATHLGSTSQRAGSASGSRRCSPSSRSGSPLTGRLGLYINPDSTWFAVGMAVLVLVGAALSFALPLGAEDDHGHDHGDGHGARPRTDAGGARARAPAPTPRRSPRPSSAGSRHPVSSLLTLVLPPASLSAELAMSRDVGAPPLFAGADAVTLATTGDTASFGVGEWATVFATATNPDAFDGDTVTLTGFVTPGDAADGFDLTRLVITHCVIDAQPASIPVAASDASRDRPVGDDHRHRQLDVRRPARDRRVIGRGDRRARGSV